VRLQVLSAEISHETNTFQHPAPRRLLRFRTGFAGWRHIAARGDQNTELARLPGQQGASNDWDITL